MHHALPEVLTGAANLGLIDVGAGGVVVFAVLAILRGWIVPRSVLVEAQRVSDARVVETQRVADDRVVEAQRVADGRTADILRVAAEQRSDARAETADWREAFRVSDARADLLSAQVAELVTQGRTSVHVLQSLTSVAQRSEAPP